MSVAEITRKEGMPNKSTIYYWILKHPEFKELYQEAKSNMADTLADEMLDIADNAENDWMKRNKPDEQGWQANRDNINRSRLRIETRKWIASKLKPKKYSETLNTKISSNEGESLSINSNTSNEELDKKLAELLTKLGESKLSGEDTLNSLIGGKESKNSEE